MRPLATLPLGVAVVVVAAVAVVVPVPVCVVPVRVVLRASGAALASEAMAVDASMAVGAADDASSAVSLTADASVLSTFAASALSPVDGAGEADDSGAGDAVVSVCCGALQAASDTNNERTNGDEKRVVFFTARECHRADRQCPW